MKSSFQEKDNYPKECFNKKIEKAIEIAHGIRKFETELFWSRTKFFYTMFAATAGGYFYIYNNINSQNNKISLKILLITSCVGLISSIAWYLVNRGSKYWMENWETHIDNLEDEVT
ncbi:MAG: hypothetical protein KatS3mg027_1625 [Bacteroidia bacterium]|nr:MAG: hypothetical protein KatS3mg027_1625 [Bacteroidia bacterium]